MGQGRQPQTPALVNDLEKLSDKLQGLLSAQGCGAEPMVVGGSGVDPVEVTDLVETILGELQRRGLALA